MSAEVSTIAHATEDLQKVLYALESVLPDSLRDKGIFTRRYVQGHHGNPITIFEARLTDSTEAQRLLDHCLSELSANDKKIVQRNLDDRFDEGGNFYIRLDKQRAVRGLIELGDEDPIRIRIKLNRLIGPPIDQIREYLEVHQSGEVS